MERTTQLPDMVENVSTTPISIGLTCWLWEWRRCRSIIRMAEQIGGVNLHLTQRCRGLRLTLEGRVSGRNVDRFISEFARHG